MNDPANLPAELRYSTHVRYNPSIYELSRLPMPEPRFNIASSLALVEAGGKIKRSTFESVASCLAEDRRRARALEQGAWDELLERCSELRLRYLHETLSDCSTDKEWWWLNLSRASATSMRELRLRFLGAVIKFVSENEHRDSAWITVSDPSWRFSETDHFWDEWQFHVPRLFRSVLRIGAVMTAPGYLITYLHVVFDPVKEIF
jgi:hypothetical protein